MLKLNQKMVGFPEHKPERIPMCVLYAVRYAHSASGSLCAQSFPSERIIFFKMLLTSLLFSSTCPFSWGWYGVVTRWCTPYFFSNARKCALLKCELPSLMMVPG